MPSDHRSSALRAAEQHLQKRLFYVVRRTRFDANHTAPVFFFVKPATKQPVIPEEGATGYSIL